MAARVHVLIKCSASDTTVNAPDTYQHGHLLIDLEGPVRGYLAWARFSALVISKCPKPSKPSTT